MSFNHNKFLSSSLCCETDDDSSSVVVTTTNPNQLIPPISLSNTITTQTMTSKLFKTNTIKAGDYYTIRMAGDFNCAPNTNILIKLALNSDNIISFMDAYSPPPSSTAWEIVIDVVFSSLNFVYGTCKFMYGDNTQTGGEATMFGPTPVLSGGFRLRNGSASYNSTIDNNMVLSWKFTSVNDANYCDAYIGSIIKS